MPNPFPRMASALAAMALAPLAGAAAPNIVYVLADDIGSGDLSAYNDHAAWRTPHLDRLASQGRRFFDAHSSSAVCTPSRYSILTGRYCWRSPRKEGVGGGYTAALLEPDRLTVPELLREHGYATAMFGKWHLGLDWPRADGSKLPPGNDDLTDGEPNRPGHPADPATQVDYRRPFGGGPTAHGFDYFFGITASLDIPPYVWLENDHVASPPTHRIGASSLPAFWRAGPIADDFAHEDVLGHLTDRAVAYLGQRAHSVPTQPFFLYFALTAPHTPIIPSAPFRGRTQTTPYGDFCVQVDDAIGRIMAALEKNGQAENTLVIVTADNGCSPMADFPGLAKFHHDPQLGRRGAKADIYEGGHRVPLIARWPGHVAAGSRSDALIGLTDLMATCAELVQAPLPPNAGEDSVSLLPALTGSAASTGRRQEIVHASINGSFAIRDAAWKLCLCPDSGGWSEPLPGHAPTGAPPFQLYDLATDPAERTNVSTLHPEIVQRLARELKHIVLSGRSTPGPNQPNEGTGPWPQTAWMQQFPN